MTTHTNPLTHLLQYVRESKEELQKVTWPSKKDVVKYSAVIVAISMFFAALFAGLDWILTLGLEQLIKRT